MDRIEKPTENQEQRRIAADKKKQMVTAVLTIANTNEPSRTNNWTLCNYLQLGY